MNCEHCGSPFIANASGACSVCGRPPMPTPTPSMAMLIVGMTDEEAEAVIQAEANPAARASLRAARAIGSVPSSTNTVAAVETLPEAFRRIEGLELRVQELEEVLRALDPEPVTAPFDARAEIP